MEVFLATTFVVALALLVAGVALVCWLTFLLAWDMVDRIIEAVRRARKAGW